MSCTEAVDNVTAYLEGELSPSRRASLEEHLAGCPACRAYLEQTRQVIQVLKGMGPEPILPQARARLLQMFRAWKKRRQEEVN